MTALILHPDPETSRRLEQDYLAAGAMVFRSGNSPETQHYEVSNPHHHAALIYLDYNTAIFGAAYAQKLAVQAVASLVIESDVIVYPEQEPGIFSVGKSVAESLGIPVVSRVEDVFSLDGDTFSVSEPTPELPKYLTKDNERFFLTEEDMKNGQLSDSSISELEVQGVPWYSSTETYQPGQPCIKLGAIIFPGGMVN